MDSSYKERRYLWILGDHVLIEDVTQNVTFKPIFKRASNSTDAYIFKYSERPFDKNTSFDQKFKEYFTRYCCPPTPPRTNSTISSICRESSSQAYNKRNRQSYEKCPSRHNGQSYEKTYNKSRKKSCSSASKSYNSSRKQTYRSSGNQNYNKPNNQPCKQTDSDLYFNQSDEQYRNQIYCPVCDIYYYQYSHQSNNQTYCSSKNPSSSQSYNTSLNASSNQSNSQNYNRSYTQSYQPFASLSKNSHCTLYCNPSNNVCHKTYYQSTNSSSNLSKNPLYNQDKNLSYSPYHIPTNRTDCHSRRLSQNMIREKFPTHSTRKQEPVYNSCSPTPMFFKFEKQNWYTPENHMDLSNNLPKQNEAMIQKNLTSGGRNTFLHGNELLLGNIESEYDSSNKCSQKKFELTKELNDDFQEQETIINNRIKFYIKKPECLLTSNLSVNNESAYEQTQKCIIEKVNDLIYSYRKLLETVKIKANNHTDDAEKHGFINERANSPICKNKKNRLQTRKIEFKNDSEGEKKLRFSNGRFNDVIKKNKKSSKRRVYKKYKKRKWMPAPSLPTIMEETETGNDGNKLRFINGGVNYHIKKIHKGSKVPLFDRNECGDYVKKLNLIHERIKTVKNEIDEFNSKNITERNKHYNSYEKKSNLVNERVNSVKNDILHAINELECMTNSRDNINCDLLQHDNDEIRSLKHRGCETTVNILLDIKQTDVNDGFSDDYKHDLILLDAQRNGEFVSKEDKATEAKNDYESSENSFEEEMHSDKEQHWNEKFKDKEKEKYDEHYSGEAKEEFHQKQKDQQLETSDQILNGQQEALNGRNFNGEQEEFLDRNGYYYCYLPEESAPRARGAGRGRFVKLRRWLRAAFCCVFPRSNGEFG